MSSTTPLQEVQQALLDVLADARDELDPYAFSVFVDFACALVAQEAARCWRWQFDYLDGER